MTDRELLELAARAADVNGHYVREHVAYGDEWIDGIDTGGLLYWNPLANDGDALRLAVKLNLHIGIDCESAGSVCIEWDFDQGGISQMYVTEDAPIDGDDYTATRRAIVRAAAIMAREK